MPSPAIEIQNVSKLYRLGEVGTGTLSQDINRWWHKVQGKEDPYLKIGQENKRDEKGGEYVWALKDINLQIEQGDVVGIIGRNGAGKSTLLKLLSRVTTPTTGSIKAKGRVASLLEVGTGFHPELTGKENVYLNGAILGMTKKEINRKFDEIVSFAGVEKYVGTPVKRYSSGMYVRLAFAVAAYLESEILIVDEVLAVGDADFQKKCIGKISEVSENEGKTVLFVSHNMDSIRNLCQKSVLLANGKVKNVGVTNEIIEDYLGGENLSNDIRFDAVEARPSITRVSLDQQLLKLGVLKLKIYYRSPYELKKLHPGLVLYNALNMPIFGSNTRYHAPQNVIEGAKEGYITAQYDNINLHSGLYKISVWLGDEYADFDSKEHAIVFEHNAEDTYAFKPDSGIIGNIDYKIKWLYGSE